MRRILNQAANAAAKRFSITAIYRAWDTSKRSGSLLIAFVD
jgi:hypothetical protein